LVTDDLLRALIGIFTDFDRVGVVGPRVVKFDKRKVITVTENDENVSQLTAKFKTKHLNVCGDYTRPVGYLSLACMVVSGQVWDDINLFGEIYSVRQFFEFDLACRVRESRNKCIYVPSITVSCRDDLHIETRYDRPAHLIFEVNRLKCKARWHRSKSITNGDGTSVTIGDLTDGIERVLFVDFETPQPDTNAGGYAAIKEMQVLQSLGYQITFLSINMRPASSYTDVLRRMGIECIIYLFFSDIVDFLSKHGRDFNFFYITRYQVALNILPYLDQYAPSIKIVLMLADLHFLRELRSALNNKNDDQLSKAVCTRENELAVMRKVDLVLSYSAVEKAVILSHNLASTKVAKCPWVCEAIDSVNSFENRLDIAFLGGFNHTPNAEAIFWFVEKVWPAVVAQLPEAQLRIYGSAIPQCIKDLVLMNTRIQVHGWVSDVANVYNSCRVFIAPLQSGAGIKGKVIGALAHGVPSVLSDIAVEGIGVCDEIHAFVALSPDEWVNRIMMLYTDQALWEQMSQHALSFAKRHYSLDNAISEMKAALSTVGIEPILEPKALVWKGRWRSVAQI
jgi:glycosyltransferase involved in cell wall biosynthesis